MEYNAIELQESHWNRAVVAWRVNEVERKV
jgi:hypothetical protein